MSPKTALIIGAGPAGLTAAYELLERTEYVPVVFERGSRMGGISQTVEYKGNRIDIGGHRFFSKSDRVMSWWLSMMPIEKSGAGSFEITYQGSTRTVTGDAAAPGSSSAAAAGPDPETTDEVMLVRDRKSRIYFLRRFFDYPISLSVDTVRKLGLFRTAKIGVSYAKASALPIRDEKTLEQFFINRFGRELYLTFFKSYTEKVWGVPCAEISSEWGAQRIKGLSVWKALKHMAGKLLPRRGGDLAQKDTETSLIERFLYPKFGPGQLWDTVARRVVDRGGSIERGSDVVRINVEGTRVASIVVRRADGTEEERRGDVFFSTMAVKDLVRAVHPPAPANVREVAEGLVYRDFITVGLLLRDLKIGETTERGRRLIRDNWIYVQEPDVLVGRMQVFNNWSPWLVADPGTVWIGLEYFCYESDEIWRKPDAEMIELAVTEMERIGIIERGSVLDGTVIRVPKTYPAYFGTYERFGEVRAWADAIDNLFLVGRNGMHRYNNQDHSMLAAMTAVDNLVTGVRSRDALWNVNAEQEYHEEK